MMKNQNFNLEDDLRPEYNLLELRKGAERGKYVQRYREGINVVLLDPDVNEYMEKLAERRETDGQEIVNEWLRSNIRLVEGTQ